MKSKTAGLIFLLVVVTASFSLAVRAEEPTCGAILTASATIDHDLDCAQEGLIIAGDDVVLACAGHRLRGNAASGFPGIWVNRARRVSIQGCRIEEFGVGIDAQGAGQLTVEQCHLLGNTYSGIRAHDAPQVTVRGNEIAGSWHPIVLIDSPESLIINNTLRADRLFSTEILESKGVEVKRNRFVRKGLFVRGSDGVTVEGNHFREGSNEIIVVQIQGCRIVGNQFAWSGSPQDKGGRIFLMDVGECDIAANILEHVDHSGIFISQGFPECRRNRIVGNTLRGGAYGIGISGSGEDLIEGNRIDEALLGIIVQSDSPQNTRTRIEGNIISNAQWGGATSNWGGVEWIRNEVRNSLIGMLERAQNPAGLAPNRYEENRLIGNRKFGFWALGTSPVLLANRFEGNGFDDGPWPDGNEAERQLFPSARAGLALVPAVGSDAALDDGDPRNDQLPAPVIGSPTRPNQFSGNETWDIYALDASGAEPAALLRNNRFLGQEPRFQREWFGLVQVLDAAGLPVEGAAVEVYSNRGLLVAEFTTNAAGFAPPEVDPLRPQGRMEPAEAGPAPTWPRYQDLTLNPAGRLVSSNPYYLIARLGRAVGCARYQWDGLAGSGESGTQVDGRYQTALIRLDAGCPAGQVRVRKPLLLPSTTD